MGRKAVTADTGTDELQAVIKARLGLDIITPSDVIGAAVAEVAALGGGGATPDAAIAALVNDPGTVTGAALSNAIAAGQGETMAVNPTMTQAEVQAVLTEAAAGSRVVFAPGMYALTSGSLTCGNNRVHIDASRATLTQSTWGQPVFDLNGCDDIVLDVGVAEYVGTRSGVGSTYRGSSAYVSTAAVWANGDRNEIRVRRSIGLVCAVFLSAWTGTSTYDRQGVGNRVRVDEVEGYNFGILWSWQKGLVIEHVYGHDDIDDSAGANPTHVLYGSAVYANRDSGVVVKSARAENNLYGHAFQFKYSDGLEATSLIARNSAGILSVIDCHDITLNGRIANSLATTGALGSVAFQSTNAFSRNPKVDVTVQLAPGVDERGALLIADYGDFTINVESEHSVAVGSGVADVNVRGTGNHVRVKNKQVGTGCKGIMVGFGSTPADDTIITEPVVTGATEMVNVVGGSKGVVVDYDPTAQRATTFITTYNGLGTEQYSSRSKRAVALSTFGENVALFPLINATPAHPTANDAIQVKVRPTRDIAVSSLVWWSVAPSGNYDIAIVDHDTNVRLWSKGSTAWPGAGKVTEAVSGGIVMRAGRTYRLVFSADNSVGTFRGWQPSLGGLDLLLDDTVNTTLVASAFPVPTPLVSGTSVSTRIPLIVVLGT